MVRFIAVLCLAAALCAPGMAEESRPALLKERLVTTDGVITLSDLFENAGEAADAVVARAPAPGERLSLDPAAVAAAAAKHGLSWTNPSRVLRLTIERAGRAVSAAELSELIEEILFVETGEIHAATLSNRGLALHAPLDAVGGPELISFEHDSRSGLFRAEVAAWPGGAPSPISGRAHRVVEVPVLARAVARGEIVTADDLEIRRLPAPNVRADVLVAASDIEGMAARRALRAGTSLRAFDLTAPVVIERGDIVSLVFESGALQLTVRARALADVGAGETGRFVNLQSNRTVEAVAAGAGLARVGPLRFETH